MVVPIRLQFAARAATFLLLIALSAQPPACASDSPVMEPAAPNPPPVTPGRSPLAPFATLTGEAWRAYAGSSVDPKHLLSALREAGVQLPETPSLPEETRAALIDLGSELRVGLRNFYVITRYNRSALYAAAVADLAEVLRAAPQSPGR